MPDDPRPYVIIHGDACTLPLADASIDAIVTDPPYNLTSGKRGGTGEASLNLNSPAGRSVIGTGGGFMGLAWDDNGNPQAFQRWCEQWASECLRVLKPGGMIIAFGGSRTWHRLTCAIEDAGFEIRDCLAWLYGSGFPKSLDVSKAIDRRGGNAHLAAEIAAAIRQAREARGWTVGQADRHFCGGSTNWTWFEGRKGECRPPTPGMFARIVAEWPELARWAEQVAAVERPVLSTTDLTYGYQRNGGRWDRGYDITAPATSDVERWQGWGTALKPAYEPIVLARKPLAGTVAGNVLTYGTGALNIDGCRIDGGIRPLIGADYKPTDNSAYEGRMDGSLQGGSRTAGTTSTGRWPANVVLDEDAAGLLDEQSGERPSGSAVRGSEPSRTGTSGIYGHHDRVPFTPHQDTGGASRFFYTAKADSVERVRVNGVAHPTVKPLDLMRWLVRLVTPPGGVVLDLFAGSGPTVEACLVEGFRCIAIEREADYLPLIRQRVNRRRDPLAYVRLAGETTGTLFDLDETT